MNTRDKLIRHTTNLYALGGKESISLRDLARSTHTATSSVYHYFGNKDILLKAMFTQLGIDLGLARSQLPPTKSASLMLKQRITFQFDHMKEVVAILKYYFDHRSQFPKQKEGYVPPTAYQHIIEVLEHGVATKQFRPMNTTKQAKIITHAINGFLLEFYPHPPSGKTKTTLINSIHQFILRSIKATH